MRNGALRHRVQLQARSATQDGAGGQANTWTTTCWLWAQVSPSGGLEKEAGGAFRGKTLHNVKMRYRPDITPAARLVFRGRYFNIVSVNDVDERKRDLDMICEEGLTVE